MPDVDAVVVPVGGAGLIAGVACAVKTLKPDCKVSPVLMVQKQCSYLSSSKSRVSIED